MRDAKWWWVRSQLLSAYQALALALGCRLSPCVTCQREAWHTLKNLICNKSLLTWRRRDTESLIWKEIILFVGYFISFISSSSSLRPLLISTCYRHSLRASYIGGQMRIKLNREPVWEFESALPIFLLFFLYSTIRIKFASSWCLKITIHFILSHLCFVHFVISFLLAK